MNRFIYVSTQFSIINKTKMVLNLKKQIKKNPFLLAPMDEVTDLPFRELCESQGASYSTSELTSIDALVRDKVFKSRYERGNLKINAVQLFGSNPDVFVAGAKMIKNQLDLIDVNFGCPSPRVTGNDAGSALLKDPKNVGKIIEKLVKNVDLPITAKIRLGYKSQNYIEVAKEIEDAGASLITLHARTAGQKYSGFANWDAIKQTYEQINIPFIGNGDVKSETDIDNYLRTHADGLMIGRAAIGNPLIFKKFQHYMKTGEKLEIENIKQAQKDLFIKYIKRLEELDVYRKDIVIQHQAMWFMKGIVGAKELRTKIARESDTNQILKYVEEF